MLTLELNYTGLITSQILISEVTVTNISMLLYRIANKLVISEVLVASNLDITEVKDTNIRIKLYRIASKLDIAEVTVASIRIMQDCYPASYL